MKRFEFIAGLISLWWGILLLLPFDTFDSARSYNFIRIIPENAWGIIALLIGAMQITGTLTHDKKLRKTGTLSAAIFWVLVGAALFLGNKLGTGVVAYAGLSLLCRMLHLEIQKAET